MRQRPEGEGRLIYVNSTKILEKGTEKALIQFDACTILSLSPLATKYGDSSWISAYKQNHKYICPTNLNFANGNPNQWSPCGGSIKCLGWRCVCDYTGGGYPGCSVITKFKNIYGTNTMELEITKNHAEVVSYGFGIDGTGLDPSTYIIIKKEKIYTGEVKTIGWSVYNTLRQLEKEIDISEKASNLFMDMAEDIAKTLTIKNCFICGGTNMGQQWPWEALEADPVILNNMTKQRNITGRSGNDQQIIWTLSTNLVGKNCFKRNGTKKVGDLICLGYWDGKYKQWTTVGNQSEPEKFNFTEWGTYLSLYWICGNQAYESLPGNWGGSCVLGWIKPSFFLLPLRTKQTLGIPIYDYLDRYKRSIDSGIPCNVETMRGNEWTPEKTVCINGPATWAEDGSWGYRTPIYMLNRIIRLQAVLELVGRKNRYCLKYFGKNY
ncbi:endogenous retrovirus group 3 member 1 Env polyprotein-like [Crotalus tigris]|uniref:endogenous retrovirus group 3 member 1 Env polyprotein-like n=1 Tax=Crotalus tigris TaxID=88082 RepID=UPI00192FA1F7|nr:endogenous retrovirus group 3 member 1 Env polyprotein-like [Crotalus tigris]XP_039179302.1 endogenous retrovirus group 3 member 1 Env polyprotein-like [Crotalus tigris]